MTNGTGVSRLLVVALQGKNCDPSVEACESVPLLCVEDLSDVLAQTSTAMAWFMSLAVLPLLYRQTYCALVPFASINLACSAELS